MKCSGSRVLFAGADAARLLLAAILLVSASGCGSGRGADEATAGRTLAFTPGIPNFDLEAVPFWGEGESGMNLYLVLPRNTLTFVREGGGYMALYEVTALFREAATGEILQDEVWAETLAVASYEETQFSSVISVTRRVRVLPGAYTVEAILRDRSSGEEARRTRRATVLEPDEQSPALGRLLLQRRTAGGGFEPLLAFHAPVPEDSLRLITELYRLPPEDTVEVGVLAIRFRTDTTVASPPYSFGRFAITGAQTLLDLRHADTVIAAGVRMRVQGNRISFRYYLPPLSNGLFRVSLRVRTLAPSRNDTVLFQHRYVLFLSPGFPRPSRYETLAAAAVYLASTEDLEIFRSAMAEDSLRRTFEAFWLGLAREDPTMARELIRRYYTRIEEANRYFTTYKEGWKTDRGMVYTVLGPPAIVEKLYDSETWHYDHRGAVTANRYRFRRMYLLNDEITLEDYVLIRSSVYESFWVDMVSRWRRGVVF